MLRANRDGTLVFVPPVTPKRLPRRLICPAYDLRWLDSEIAAYYQRQVATTKI
jgi:hypothetical protein